MKKKNDKEEKTKMNKDDKYSNPVTVWKCCMFLLTRNLQTVKSTLILILTHTRVQKYITCKSE